MRPFTFPMIRLQVVDMIDDDPKIIKAVCELSLHLTMKHLHLGNGFCAITDEKLAERLGWTLDKVSRTVRVLTSSGLFDVTRGRWLRATEYKLSDTAWAEATARRNAAHKITNLIEHHTPEKSLSYSGKIQPLTSEKSPPLKKYKHERTDAKWDSAVFNPVHVPLNSFSVKQWNECLKDNRCPELSRMFATTVVGGIKGYWVPQEYPSTGDSENRAAQIKILREWEAQQNNSRSKFGSAP